MHRIDSRYAAPELPEPREAEAEPGYFQNGDEESETAGTVLDADWVNTVQEELINVVTQAGLTPTKGQRDQVTAGVRALVAKSPQVTGAIAAAQAAADLASEAKTAASQSKARADEALTEAGKAKAEAGQAFSRAVEAVAIASGVGVYTVDDTVRDADAAWESSEKSYLTNTGNVNFPTGLAAPYFFEVILNSDGSATTQRCWMSGGDVCSRTGSVNNSDPDNMATTWGEWKSTENIPEATTTVAGKVTLATAEDKTDTAKVPPAAVVQSWLDEAGGGFSTLEVITTSGTFTAKKTGYHRITCIGGGGSGGRAASGANAYNGATGGTTSVSTITASGGAGGHGAQNNGGGGGGSGLITIGYLYLQAGDDVAVIIGAGAGVTTAAGTDGTGQGAPGASNGTVTSAGSFRSGVGGRNDYGYGNGGNGAASTAVTGLNGSNGAVFVEY